ncbi:MAG TPA: PDZ domain-containing protein, partial [Bryobacteraceae bacterium]|nr:PDZ domain-containing protein [Bryobacteraceae bacterium]
MDKTGQYYPESEARAFWSGKPRFYWLVLIFTGLLLLVFPFQIFQILRHGDTLSTTGWTATESQGIWTITQIQRAGPATGKLKRGDKLLSINGNEHAAHTGPLWFFNHKSPGDRYTVDVQRDGARLSFQLPIGATRVAGQRFWGSLQMIVALIFLGTGAIIGLGKASESTGRYAFLSAALSAMFLFSIASTVMRRGGAQGWPLWIAIVMDCAFAIHYLYGYWFYSRFPQPVGRTRSWAVFEYLLAGVALTLWALGVGFNVLSGLPEAMAVAFANSQEQITAAFLWGADTSTRKFFGIFTNLAMTAVCWRNFRLIPEGDQRRRLRWAFFGALATVIPSCLIMAFWYAVTLLPNFSDLTGLSFTLSRAVNIIVVIMPITMAYAILKHRVLGFGVAIRIGIQHLLATNVLRLLFLLPFAALVYELVTGRDKTISALLWQGATKWYLLLAVCFAAGNRYRRQVTTAIDKRFFREAYNQETVLTVLADTIKELDSVEEIAALLSAEINKALHPRWIAVLYRQNRQSGLSMAYATDDTSRRLQAAGLGGTLEQLEHASHARDWQSIRSVCPPNERMTFDLADANLLVPIMGTEHRLMGILVLGEKKSEEPYIAKDRALLERVGHEAGIVYENLELRGQVRKERQVQVEVLARVANHDLNLVKECSVCGRCFDSSAEKCTQDDADLSFTLPVERTIDSRYRLDRRIGKGGMGAVYEAMDLRLNRAVAVKVMTGSLFGQTSAMRRFSREAQASARLVHPNIVRLYDYGELA